jgi:calcineurin-like phosphoesterase
MSSSHVQRSGGVWVTKPFKNWKKAVEKMKAHARIDFHSHATATLLAANI